MATKPTTKPLPKLRAILYIAKSHLDLYIDNTTQVVRFDYPDVAIRDMEVINRDVLFVQIATLIEQKKITPAETLVLLSPASVFEKDFPDDVTLASQQAIQNFLDNVPFENIASKTLRFKKGVKVIAANKEMYDSIELPFKRHGFKIVAAVPFFAAVENAQELTGGLTPQLGKSLLQKFDSLKQQNMIPLEDPTDYRTVEKREEEIEVKTTQKKHELTLIAVFGVLISILVVMVIVNFILPQKPKPAPPAPAPAAVVPTPTAEPTPEQTASPSASLEDKQKLKIRILNGSGVPGQADLIKKALETAEFQNIETGNAGSASNPKTLIVFAESVKPVLRDIITTEVQKIFPNTSIQQSADTSFDVIITTGQPPPSPTVTK